MSPSTANTSSAAWIVPEAGGSSMKHVLTAEKKFTTFKPNRERKLLKMTSPKLLQKMMMNSSQDVHNAGQTSIKMRTKKCVSYAAATSSTRDVKCFPPDSGSATVV